MLKSFIVVILLYYSCEVQSKTLNSPPLNTPITKTENTKLDQLEVVLWQAKLLPSPNDQQDSAHRLFGRSVAYDGSTAVIGATGSALNVENVVYIFHYDGKNWVMQQKLMGSESLVHDGFGSSVDISNNRLIVGAPFNKNNNITSGSAYIFEFINGSWLETQKLRASDYGNGDQFGHSVSMSGDTLLIGAHLNNVGKRDNGSAYVFNFDGSQWIETQQLTGSGDTTDERFGSAVKHTADKAMISAPFNGLATSFDKNLAIPLGVVYMFEFNGTQWTETQKINASDGTSVDKFGCSIDFEDNLALVGSCRANHQGSNTGSAYLFTYDGLTWNESQKLFAPDGQEDDQFGYAVSLNGDHVLIGAPYHRNYGSRSGVSYYFRFDGNMWNLESKVFPLSEAPNDIFGSSVSMSNQVALIGAPWDDDNGENAGIIYQFSLKNNQWSEENKLLPKGNAARDEFGYSVSLSGDRALVGARKDNDKDFDSGSVYVFEYNELQWQVTEKLIGSKGYADNEFGFTVALSGDTAMVGARHHVNKGAVYVFNYDGNKWLEQQIISPTGTQSHFGRSISIYKNRVLIGAPYININGLYEQGSVFIYEYDGLQWSEVQMLTSSDPNEDEKFGIDVSLYDNWALIGASGDDSNGYSSGSAQMFHFDGNTWVNQQKLVPANNETRDAFGSAVSIEGKWAVIGSPAKTDGLSGAAYVYHFNGNSWQEMQMLVPSDQQQLSSFSRFGNEVTLAKDKVLIGSDLNGDSKYNPGATYLFKLNQMHWYEAKKITAFDGASNDHFGFSASISNGKAIIGSRLDDDHGFESGSAHIFDLEATDLIFTNSFD